MFGDHEMGPCPFVPFFNGCRYLHVEEPYGLFCQA